MWFQPHVSANIALLAALALCSGCGGDDTDTVPKRGGPGEGRWHTYRTHRFDEGLTEEQRAEIAALEALGYADGKHTTDVPRGVTRHVTERIAPGLNFVNSAHAAQAQLVDSMGVVRHTWALPFEVAFPDFPGEHNHRSFWRRTHLYDNGDLLAIFEGLGIIRIDKDSNLLWVSRERAHHDAAALPDGTVWVLTREAHLVPRLHKRKPVLEDFVSLLDATGQVVRSISVVRALEDSPFRELWSGKVWRGGELLHTNALELLDGSLAESHPAFKAGNLLLSMRLTHMLAVLDPMLEQIVWASTGSYRFQHDPTVLENGRLLIFDNNPAREASAILEIDPATGEETVSYKGPDSDPFYSETCGLAQRLPNGNTLITESDYGRALEVTPDGETVWEFYSPFSAGENDEYIATLMEVVRLPGGPLPNWLKNPGEMPGKGSEGR
ncbi:MAG: arylsulfotransferase family protein [Planctomycetota bacterium]|jgi:hypothetical protein|nr:arylsulfotransferase family protein [Planctomycetota bacterium]